MANGDWISVGVESDGVSSWVATGRQIDLVQCGRIDRRGRRGDRRDGSRLGRLAPTPDDRRPAGARHAETGGVLGVAAHQGVGQVEGRALGSVESDAGRTVAVPVAHERLPAGVRLSVGEGIVGKPGDEGVGEVERRVLGGVEPHAVDMIAIPIADQRLPPAVGLAIAEGVLGVTGREGTREIERRSATVVESHARRGRRRSSRRPAESSLRPTRRKRT